MEAEHLAGLSFRRVRIVKSQGERGVLPWAACDLWETTVKWSLIGVKEKTGDCQRSTICPARYMGDTEMGICICFEN